MAKNFKTLRKKMPPVREAKKPVDWVIVFWSVIAFLGLLVLAVVPRMK